MAKRDRRGYTSDDVTNLVVTHELMNSAVGAYMARIYAEEAAAEPDREAIAAWQAAVGDCIRERRSLSLSDPAAIAEARQRYAARLEVLSPRPDRR